jgi:hypothetical protein
MAVAKEDDKKTALTPVSAAGLPAEFLAELAEDAGAGVSTSAEDGVVPFIVLLQDMSPEVKKRDPGYVPGAEPGMLMNKANKQLYAAAYDDKTAPTDDIPLLTFQPCAFERAVIEWIPRTDGGGFVAKHALIGTFEDTMQRIGARQVEVTNERGEVESKWRTANGKNDLIDTRYHYGNIIGADGSLTPAVIAMSSTGHTASKQWMELMKQKTRSGDQLFIPPSWAKVYPVHSKPKVNNKGDFFVFTVDPGTFVTDSSIRAVGKELNAAFASGAVRTDESSLNEGGSEGGRDEGDMPI